MRLLFCEGPEGVKWDWDWPTIWVGKWDLSGTGIFVLGMGLKTLSMNGNFVLTH